MEKPHQREQSEKQWQQEEKTITPQPIVGDCGGRPAASGMSWMISSHPMSEMQVTHLHN
jgi:hypothetical protein